MSDPRGTIVSIREDVSKAFTNDHEYCSRCGELLHISRLVVWAQVHPDLRSIWPEVDKVSLRVFTPEELHARFGRERRGAAELILVCLLCSSGSDVPLVTMTKK